jgi:glutathione synthase/RimK-type ligase-like ATP-grasp enzyme
MASTLPTLVFSPCALKNQHFSTARHFCGRAVDKLTQLRELQRIGVPVPISIELDKVESVPAVEWGSHVLIKPTGPRSSQGRGFIVVPAGKLLEFCERNRSRSVDEYPYMAQQFIPTGDRARHYRVNTLFGAALYCMLNERVTSGPDFSLHEDVIVSDEVATNVHDPRARQLKLVDDADVIDLARRCHAAFPQIPLKGVDIVRESGTGRLFALELNCTSNTWHVSSDYFSEFRTGEVTREKMIAQFGMFGIAAQQLIKVTRFFAKM